MNNKVRYPYMDVIAAVACFLVVGIHCNKGLNMYASNASWGISVFVNALYYPANALFFMLSGAKLLDYRERYSTIQFLKTRFIRIGIPLLFWSLVGLFIRYLEGSFTFSVREATRLLLTNGIIYNGIYWFMYTLAGLYLSYPVLSAIHRQNRRQVYGFFVLLSWLCFSIQPFIMNNYLHEWNNSTPLDFAVSTQYLMYAVWGYWLARFELKKWHRIGFYCYGIAGFILLSIGTMYWSDSVGAFNARYCGWAGFPCFGMATALFISAKQGLNQLPDRVRRLFKTLGGCSFGVYLLHPFVIWALETLYNTHPGVENLWKNGGIVGLCLVYPVSLMLSYALKRIPFLRRFIP